MSNIQTKDKHSLRILSPLAYFYPEQTASSHLDQDRFEAYKNEDIFTIIHVPVPSRGIDEATRKRYKNIKEETLYEGTVTVKRFPLFKEGKNTLMRAIRYLLMNIIEWNRCRKEENIDLILCGSTPPTQPLLGSLIKKCLIKKYKKYVPLLYVVQDIFPDSLVNSQITNKNSIVWKIGRKVADNAYFNADRIITISEEFKRSIVNTGVPANKIIVIPNWVNTDNICPIDREKNILFDKYHLDKKLFYICYSGNLGLSQNLDLLLSAAKRIKKEILDVRFVLIGEGVEKENLKKIIEKENITNIIMLPFQDYSAISHVFSLGDVGLVISKPGIGSSSVPSKTWSIMAAERPILASFDIDSVLVRLLKKTKSGIFVEPDDIDGFVKAIHILHSNKIERVRFGKNGRKYVKEHLNKQICTQMYIDTIFQVVTNNEE